MAIYFIWKNMYSKIYCEKAEHGKLPQGCLREFSVLSSMAATGHT